MRGADRRADLRRWAAWIVAAVREAGWLERRHAASGESAVRDG